MSMSHALRTQFKLGEWYEIPCDILKTGLGKRDYIKLQFVKVVNSTGTRHFIFLSTSGWKITFTQEELYVKGL